MFVQQALQTQIGIIQDIPKNVLAGLAIGQRVEAVVIAVTASSEMISIKLADSVLDIRSPVLLQAGQKVQLELVSQNGKPVLQLIPPASVSESVSLKPGQQMAVEVIKVLADNKVLVQTTPLLTARNKATPILTDSNKTTPQLTDGNKTTPLLTESNKAMPPSQKIEVDVSQLSQKHKVGDKLLMEVVNTKPLSIQLRPEQALPREHIILDRIRQLLPQQAESPNLKKVISSFQNKQLPEPVQKAVQQLIQHSLDKPKLTEPQALKQAVATSGVVMERQLLNQPSQSTQDFKANLLNVLKAVETVITDNKGQLSDKAINKLPAQVQTALTANGRTPAQVLNVLLSGKSVPSLLSSVTPQAQASLPTILNQQQAASLVALLIKPLTPTNTQAVSRHVSMDLLELMQLFKEVEGVHNKLQLNQLNMLKEPESGTTAASWLFDVPIKDKQALDLLQIQIDQHKQKIDEQDNEIWNVKLRLDTQNLGPVQATVTLQDEDVKVIIRAEKKESAQLLADNMPLLDEAMDKLGVSMSHSSCSCGPVDKAINIESGNQLLTDALLDVSV